MNAAQRELSADEEAVLEALESIDPDGARRVDVAEAIESGDYPELELPLLDRELIEKVGTHIVREGDETAIYDLVGLTESGRKALARARRPDPEPESLEPERREGATTPWSESDDWRDLSADVDRIMDEFVSIGFDEEAEEVTLTLERDGTEADLTFSLPAWLNTGRNRFFDEYRAAFHVAPNIDDREWGILQARLIDQYEEMGG